MSFNFLTCYGIKNELNFEAYFQPYSESAWIAKVLSVVFLALFFTFASNELPRTLQNVSKRFFRPIFELVSTLLKQGINLRNITLKESLKLLSLLWIVMMIVISNAYEGFATEVRGQLSQKCKPVSAEGARQLAFST